MIQNADVQSFVSLGNKYAKDKNKVYYEGKILADADPNSFTLVDHYAKDMKHVFYDDKILNAEIDIDPSYFVVVGGGAIKDDRRVYFRNYYKDSYDLVIRADAPTFQFVGTCASFEKSSRSYFKDKNSVFTQKISEGNPLNPVSQIDISSFHFFGIYGVAEGVPYYSVSYAKDKNNIYSSCGEILDGADVASFADLKDGYVKDKNKVWYLADIISGADVATFTIVRENVAADEYGSVYAKDKSNVYFGSEIIEGVNPASCTIESIENCSPNPSS